MSVVQLYGVGCATVWCQWVVQLYGVGWLCNCMVSVGFAAIWCWLVVQYMVSVVQLYGVGWFATIWCQLCNSMVSVGCQFYGVSRLCNYMVLVGCSTKWCHTLLITCQIVGKGTCK